VRISRPIICFKREFLDYDGLASVAGNVDALPKGPGAEQYGLIGLHERSHEIVRIGVSRRRGDYGNSVGHQFREQLVAGQR
jgi:hypothetical protein